MFVCVCMCVLVTLIIKLWLRVLHQVPPYSFLPNGKQLKISNAVIVIIQIYEIIYNLVQVLFFPVTLHLGDPCEGLGKDQDFGGNQPPLSFLLSSQHFRTFQCHFHLKHLPRVLVEPLMERKSLCKQAACSWHSSLHRAIYQNTRAIWRDKICHTVLQHQVSYPQCGQSHRKNKKLFGLTCSVPDIPYEATWNTQSAPSQAANMAL